MHGTYLFAQGEMGLARPAHGSGTGQVQEYRGINVDQASSSALSLNFPADDALRLKERMLF